MKQKTKIVFKDRENPLAVSMLGDGIKTANLVDHLLKTAGGSPAGIFKQGTSRFFGNNTGANE
jgi:hypothetical protein